MKRDFWFLGLALLCLGGCLLKPYLPQPAAEYSVEEGWAIIDADSLILFARPQAYSGEVQPVAANFFTLYLRVKNKSPRTLSLPRGGFSISTQQQHDPVPLSLVLGSLQSGLFLNEPEDPFAPMTAETQDLALERARERYFELMNGYFSFGDILPGGVKEGYLFYNERIDRTDSFVFDALGTRVLFQRR